MLMLRRALYIALALLFAVLPLWMVARALSPGGWTVWELLLLAALVPTSPWVGNMAASSLIGVAVLLFARDPLAAVWPSVARSAEIPFRTALLLCIRNEDTDAALARAAPLLDGLAVEGDRFALFILSDTPDGAHAAAEEAAVARFRAGRADAARVHYRRRSDNTGFKAGNVMEFVQNRAGGFEAMITLDADSVMTADAVRELARLLAANPDTALIQTLIVARPALVPFARLFQFGMRHGMRAYAAGIAWWQGEDGPYWGHNAIIRIAPFAAHGRLPSLPGGGTILSHDQVEAALLRGAGFAVRLDPRETGSYEANPPSLLAFLQRDIRWMAGNLQYFALLRLPQFTAVGRLNLVFAILLFAWAPLAVLARTRRARQRAVVRPCGGDRPFLGHRGDSGLSRGLLLPQAARCGAGGVGRAGTCDLWRRGDAGQGRRDRVRPRPGARGDQGGEPDGGNGGAGLRAAHRLGAAIARRTRRHLGRGVARPLVAQPRWHRGARRLCRGRPRALALGTAVPGRARACCAALCLGVGAAQRGRDGTRGPRRHPRGT
ncbi:MAG: glucans biosynthesis glucosyltransferase MdoH [Acetobacteraceae bacterium]|nr:glucans biosynthesis glucosyltransferase MdoH [Acetobacteraceae bacterium]